LQEELFFCYKLRKDNIQMRYLKIFLSIFYFIVVSVYAFFMRFNLSIFYDNDAIWYFLKRHKNIMTILSYLPSILLLLSAIGFFIYFMLIKDNNLFWGAFSLSFGVGNLIDLIFTVPMLVYYSNYLSPSTSELIVYSQFCVLTFRFLIFIGLLILFLFFRSKYHKSLNIISK